MQIGMIACLFIATNCSCIHPSVLDRRCYPAGRLGLRVAKPLSSAQRPAEVQVGLLEGIRFSASLQICTASKSSFTIREQQLLAA
ncbi:hypothetical protein BZA77DRAFT_305821 [Pyronema omphalodes]|nr:hypothetical protein BZA77DRAFT_305821 [Pyronema omphalodes]